MRCPQILGQFEIDFFYKENDNELYAQGCFNYVFRQTVNLKNE